jgi:hypothetical protein
MELSPDWENVRTLVVRGATVNGLAYAANVGQVYLAESGANDLSLITLDGATRNIANLPFLDHFQQPVPAGVAVDPQTGELLVALFSGRVRDYYGVTLAYMPGDSQIVRVNPETGEQTIVIEGLTTAVDVATDEMDNIFVVELTTGWPTATMPRDYELFNPDAPPDPGGYPRFRVG